MTKTFVKIVKMFNKIVNFCFQSKEAYYMKNPTSYSFCYVKRYMNFKWLQKNVNRKLLEESSQLLEISIVETIDIFIFMKFNLLENYLFRFYWLITKMRLSFIRLLSIWRQFSYIYFCLKFHACLKVYFSIK